MKRVILYLVLVFECLLISAQQITYYSCDFEDQDVNADWTLNPGPYGQDIKNRWYIGKAINNGGMQSMYISANGGDSAYYTSAGCVAVSYVELDLEAGEYVLSFDWRARGHVSEGTEGLYVAWVPNEDWDYDNEGNPILKTIPVNSSPSNAYSNQLLPYTFLLDDFYGREYLGNSTTWRNKQLTFSTDGKPHKLAFFWRSSESTPLNPGACIDNILVMSTELCEAPTNFKYEDDGVGGYTLSWEGDETATYNVRYYNYISQKWSELNVTGTTVTLPNMEEGATDFYVRQECGRDNKGQILYSPPLFSSGFVYIISQHCLDYLTLTDQNCFWADLQNGWPGSTTNGVQFQPGMIDFGPTEWMSRHTVCKDPYDYDPLTTMSDGTALKIIPDGEIASIRIGNWNNTHEADRMEFRFHVDNNVNPMVILKYAMVLESGGHSDDVQPRFEMKVLDQRGNVLGNAQCVTADFTANHVFNNPNIDMAAEGWHIIDMPITVPSDGVATPDKTRTINPGNVVWKDWTQVGVNLKDYDGQDVIVQLSTYDCAQTAHFGYAYFVLRCSKGELEGMTCGQVNPTFSAPEGFEYRWYNKKDAALVELNSRFNTWDESLIVSRNVSITVGTQDDEVYCVDCMFAGDTTCYFTLEASALPRFPRANGEVQILREDCQNKLRLSSDCYIEELNHMTNESTRLNLLCDYVWWDFGDGTTSYQTNPADHIYPETGGKYTVTLHAVYQTCEDVMQFDVEFAPIGETETTIDAIGCVGTGYRVQYQDYTGTTVIDKSYYETGEYRETITSSVGCDSVIVLNLLMVEREETTIDTTILNDDAYRYEKFPGQYEIVNKTGVYMGYLNSSAGCDSVVTHNLVVYERLLVDMDSIFEICADDPYAYLKYIFTSGRTTTFSLIDVSGVLDNIEMGELPEMPIGQNDDEIELQLPELLKADYYPMTIIFHDTISGDVEKNVTLAVHYPDSIIVQRWNDVLGIKNSEYNGGYEFVSYQWYKDNEMIVGATGPYLYVETGLDLEAQYYAQVMRNDSVSLFICPFTPLDLSGDENIPTLQFVGQNIKRTQPGLVRWINTVGDVVYTEYYTVQTGITVPLVNSGYYLMSVTESGKNLVKKVYIK